CAREGAPYWYFDVW
nr:immunoglobulin heavy chain junction region [Mus musculus]MBK4196060.1 immunoglobulin heavy chain junction region [Mus musculus]MBK4196061.1 immunoglobulin heavy chain junction region [Mus musculus]MBK4198685.1 immunoglobulin heavy chain junction region [Mus musculus]MBK4198686.1 immunoglobulin heavy chain junction region [Mus musculus]